MSTFITKVIFNTKLLYLSSSENKHNNKGFYDSLFDHLLPWENHKLNIENLG